MSEVEYCSIPYVNKPVSRIFYGTAIQPEFWTGKSGGESVGLWLCDISGPGNTEARTWYKKTGMPVIAYSKERGVHVVIEDTPELNLRLCKAADVKAVLDRVEGLELVYDSGNMLFCGEKPISYIDPFVGRIGYVHLKDMRPAPVGSMMMDLDKDGNPMSSAPIGTGLVDLPAVTKKLKEIGYDGSYSVEFFGDDDRDYLKSIRRTKEYVTDILAL